MEVIIMQETVLEILEEICEAVSYTHLDVYKRQAGNSLSHSADKISSSPLPPDDTQYPQYSCKTPDSVPAADNGFSSSGLQIPPPPADAFPS